MNRDSMNGGRSLSSSSSSSNRIRHYHRAPSPPPPLPSLERQHRQQQHHHHSPHIQQKQKRKRVNRYCRVSSCGNTLRRIDNIVSSIVSSLDRGEDPALLFSGPPDAEKVGSIVNSKSSSGYSRSILNPMQSRAYAGTIMVLSFVQKLLNGRRTATNREVYYFFVTHFKSQRECDNAIVDASNILGVPRIELGLTASPRGWFCGRIKITRLCSDSPVTTDGTALASDQGLPITREWIDRCSEWEKIPENPYDSTNTSKYDDDETDNSSSSCDISSNSGRKNKSNESSFSSFKISSDAKCILVIEKEGAYKRLSEERFYDRYPCVLVTGRGYPDLATRALVYSLHNELGIPVFGLCDCDPHGVSVLRTYRRGSERRGVDGGDRYGVPIGWLGLRPSQVDALEERLPREVYLSMTDHDKRRVEGLINESGDEAFVNERILRREDVRNDNINKSGQGERAKEIKRMTISGRKVELEALHWLGMNFTGQWLEEILWLHERQAKNSEVTPLEKTIL